MALLFAGEDQYASLLRTYTDAAASQVGLSADQLFAFAEGIIAQESGWNAKAYHFDGPDPVDNASYGLMQVEGVTAEGYGMSKAAVAAGGLYDVPTNLQYGVQRLVEALQRQGNIISLAAADYNEGPGNLAAGNPDSAYVNPVVNYYTQYFTANTGNVPSDPTQGPSAGSGLALAGLVLTLGFLFRRRLGF